MSEQVRFGDLLQIPLRNGVSYPSAQRGSGHPMVNMREIFAHDRIGDVECELAPLTQAEQSQYLLSPGDLLFARQSLTYEGAGKCSIVLDGRPDRTWESHIIRARLDASVSCPAFFYYYFRSSLGRRSIESIIQQVAAAGIRGSDLSRLPVPHPPIAAQQAIAEVLGALDDKIAANTRLARTAEYLAAGEFSRLAQLSSDVVSVGELIASAALVMSDGYRTKRSELGDAGYRIVRVADVRDGLVHLDSPDFVLAEYATAIGQKFGIAGDILLTTKGTVGRVAVLPATGESVVYSPQLCFFRVISESVMTRSFLRLWLTSPEFLEQAGHRKNNTDMAPYINLADIRSLRITLPPVAAQVEAGHVLDALEAKVHACHRENGSLAATRDALLPELMSGRLRVRDAEAAVAAQH
ncbi:MAG: restriction endonuclease subunit S [Sporichthyaceae bacterium]